jgi:hypothetical protein
MRNSIRLLCSTVFKQHHILLPWGLIIFSSLPNSTRNFCSDTILFPATFHSNTRITIICFTGTSHRALFPPFCAALTSVIGKLVLLWYLQMTMNRSFVSIKLLRDEIYIYLISYLVSVTPKFKDKFEYNKPRVCPKNSRACESTNYRSIITSVLQRDYYIIENQSLATSKK